METEEELLTSAGPLAEAEECVIRLGMLLVANDSTWNEVGFTLLGVGDEESEARLPKSCGKKKPEDSMLRWRKYFATLDGCKIAINLTFLSVLLLAARRMTRNYKLLGSFKWECVNAVSVLLNPDCDTLWNRRRDYILTRLEQLVCKSDKKRLLMKERRLLNLILTKHFKSDPCWTYRKWLLRIHLDVIALQGKSENTKDILEHEIAVCHRAVTSYPRCYPAWTYRIGILQLLRSMPEGTMLLDAERFRLREHVYRNVSDFSGMVCLQRIVEYLPHQKKAAVQEIEYANILVTKYPGHCALWNHQRALFHILIEACDAEELPTLEHMLTLGESMLVLDLTRSKARSEDLQYSTLIQIDDLNVSEVLLNQLRLAYAFAEGGIDFIDLLQQQFSLAYIIHICRSMLVKKQKPLPRVNSRLSFQMPGRNTSIENIDRWQREATLLIKLALQ